MNKGTCQSAVRDQRHIQIDGSTPNLVAICQLMCRQILGDIYHHVDLMLMQEVEGFHP